MAHGGARPNTGAKAAPKRTGRPPKPVTTEEKNAAFDEKAMAALPALFETLMTIASGYKVVVTKPPRGIPSEVVLGPNLETYHAYLVPPDKAAAMYLVDRASGKAAVKSPEQTETELILEFVMPSPDEDEDA